MHQDNLLNILCGSVPFSSVDEAQQALSRTLEAVAYVLPRTLAVDLAKELPLCCAASLYQGLRASDSARGLGHAQSACIPGELSEQALAEISAVCGVLGSVLPLDFVRNLDAALPPPLSGMLTRYLSAPRGLASRPIDLPSSIVHIEQHGDTPRVRS